ncbi:MAG: hypothetical protein OXB84_06870, partial [Halobacteriovoraceae bacterium]|nr:hypothetical protein [Halobacteriovoraceae bacterium]
MRIFDLKSARLRNCFRSLGVFFCLLFLRLPVFSFVFSYSSRKKVKVYENDFALLCNWDCGHYRELAKDYSFGNAFFPLFPNISRVVSQISDLGVQTSLIATSFAFSLLSSWLALVFMDTCFKSKGRQFLGYSYRAWIFVVLLMCYPRALVFIFGYPESLFLCLLFLSLIAWYKNKIFWSAGLIGLTAVTRAQGIWLAAVLGIFWFVSEI